MEKPKLLVDYDEEQQIVRFFAATPGHERNHSVVPRVLPHLELKLAQLSEKGPDEVERIIGGSVLAFFEFQWETKPEFETTARRRRRLPKYLQRMTTRAAGQSGC